MFTNNRSNVNSPNIDCNLYCEYPQNGPFTHSYCFLVPLPEDLRRDKDGTHPTTPQRCGVWWAKAFERELNIKISRESITNVTGLSLSSQTRVIKSGQSRTFHNQPDDTVGPETRGRKRILTTQDTRAIFDYLTDKKISIDEKGESWLTIAEEAGIELPQTWHFKPEGYREIEIKPIQRAC